MSEVKYKAVPEYNGCEGCCNLTEKGEMVNPCEDFMKMRMSEGLPNCDPDIGQGYIYQLDTEIDTSTVTLEQAREKFENHYGYQEAVRKNEDGTYCELTTDLQWEGYLQALKDFNILEEGE